VHPGVLFVGVNDDGTCANLAVDDRLLQVLAQMASGGNVLPPPTLGIEKRTVAGCTLAVVVVTPADLRVPEGARKPEGCVVMQHAVRLDRPVKAYARWMERIPSSYREAVLRKPAKAPIAIEKDPPTASRR
jgi:hypothetical protein